MTVDQLPSRVREFANYLNGLLARLDQGAGWCAVFWQRDPDGMQACLGGREVPPWDVVEALLQDLATRYGHPAVARETEQARFLHEDALAAYDSRPGAREELADRLDVTLREQRYATERLAQLGRALDSTHSREAAEALDVDLAWARDDHERATARCAELRSRMGRLEHRAELADRLRSARTTEHGGGGAPFRVGGASSTAEAGAVGAVGAAGDPVASATGAGGGRPGGPAGKASTPVAPSAPGPADPSSVNGAVAASANGPAIPGHPHGPTPDGGTTAWTPAVTPEPVPDPVPAKQRKRRRGSARFAGMAENEAVPALVPQAPEASSVPAATTGRRTPRGARFAGAAEVPVRPGPAVAQPDEEAGQAVTAAVERLVRLRAEGRTGEAHALLAEVAHWAAARFPLLADALQRSGLGADWATLLWETASLPAARLVAAADALTAAGRTEDGRQILRQGVVRPAAEIGRAVLALDTEGRHREVRALLDTYVQVRTPEEAAHSAEPDPQRLVPLLLRSAQAISDQRQWDLLHALRVAGFAS
ncbi:hypothetical protein ACIRQQ_02100 [Streptomyces fuscichromogenes]|uniref:hypothetical protein n=1 Tax=Streptomyces fuscichromogenes TaxID=1324013 RepID=UPI003825EEA2